MIIDRSRGLKTLKLCFQKNEKENEIVNVLHWHKSLLFYQNDVMYKHKEQRISDQNLT